MAGATFVVSVLGMKDFSSAKDAKSSVYFSVTLLNDLGQTVGKPIKSKSIKLNALSNGNASTIEFGMPKGFAGIGLQCISKGIFKDKQLGVITIKFNTQMINGDLIVDDYFNLSTKRKDNKVFAKTHLLIKEKNAKHKDVKQVEIAAESESSEEKEKPKGEKKEKPSLKLSSKWANQDSRLKTSAFVVIEEDEDETDANASSPALQAPAPTTTQSEVPVPAPSSASAPAPVPEAALEEDVESDVSMKSSEDSDGDAPPLPARTLSDVLDRSEDCAKK